MAQHAQDLADRATVGAPAPRPHVAQPAPTPLVPVAEPLPHPWPIGLRPGCYRLTFRPDAGGPDLHGTLRVDRRAARTTVSGDLYRHPRLAGTPTAVAPEPGAAPHSMSSLGRPVRPLDLPAHPRERYHSYLRVTGVRTPPPLTHGACPVTIVAEEYRCTDPAAGACAATPRVVTIALEPKPRAPGYTARYLTGTLYEDGVAQGRVTLGWVSASFRRAALGTGALAGAATPLDGQDLRGVLAAAGWKLTIGAREPNPVAAPAAWSYADAHALLSALRVPASGRGGEDVRHQLVHLPDPVVRPRG